MPVKKFPAKLFGRASSGVGRAYSSRKGLLFSEGKMAGIIQRATLFFKTVKCYPVRAESFPREAPRRKVAFSTVAEEHEVPRELRRNEEDEIDVTRSPTAPSSVRAMPFVLCANVAPSAHQPLIRAPRHRSAGSLGIKEKQRPTTGRRVGAA